MFKSKNLFLDTAMSEDNLLPLRRPSTSKPRLESKNKCLKIPRSSAIFPRRMSSMEIIENTNFSGEREIRQFLDTVPVLPKLSKMPDISKFLNKGKTIHKSRRVNDRDNIIKNYMQVSLIT